MENPSNTSNPPPPATQRTGHRSWLSWIVFGGLTLLAIAGNWTGRIVVTPKLDLDRPPMQGFPSQLQAWHGWPFTFLKRNAAPVDPPAISKLSQWKLFEAVESFDLLMLFANLAVCLTIIIIVGRLLASTLSRRSHMFQARLSDFVFVGILVGILTAIYANNNAMFRREAATLALINKRTDYARWGRWPLGSRAIWAPTGPSQWLPSWGLEWPFSTFHRVYSIRVSGDELPYVSRLTRMTSLTVDGVATSEQLSFTSNMSWLEALDLSEVFVGDLDVREVGGQLRMSTKPLTLPPLPQVRGLDMSHVAYQGSGLEHLRRVEVLSLRATDVNDQVVPKLVELRRLLVLDVRETKITAAGLATLRGALPGCEIRCDP